MKDCEAMRERLSALLDGELDETEAEALRAHLEHCPDCRAFYAAMQGLSELLEPEPVPADLHAGIMARFDQRERVLARQKRLGRLRPLFSLAAAAAILVGTVLTLGRMHFGKSSAPPEAQTYAMTAEAPMEAADVPEQNEALFSTGAAQPFPEADGAAECEEADCDAFAADPAEAPQAPAAARNESAVYDAADKDMEAADVLPSPDAVSRAELERLPDGPLRIWRERDAIALLLEGLDWAGDDAEAEGGGWLSFYRGGELLLRLYLNESACAALEARMDQQG